MICSPSRVSSGLRVDVSLHRFVRMSGRLTYKQLSNISNPSSAIDSLMVSGGKKVSVFSWVVNSNPFFKLFC